MKRCSYKCILLIKVRPVFNIQKGLIAVTHYDEQEISENKNLKFGTGRELGSEIPPDARSLTRNPVVGVEGIGSSSQIYDKIRNVLDEIQLLTYWIWVSFMLSPSMHCGW